MYRLAPAVLLFACSSSTRTVPGDADKKETDSAAADAAPTEVPDEPKPHGPQPPDGHAMSADLDGDGKADRIIVTRDEVWIEGQRALHPEIETLASWEYKIVDFDRSDGRQELVLLDPGDGNASILVYSYFDGVINTTRRLPVGDWPESLPGNGVFRVLGNSCGQSTTWVYRLHDGKLVEVSKQTTGVYDEDLCL